MIHDQALARVLANDDHLDLRQARRAGAKETDEACRVLFHYEETCEQCSRRTWRPHIAGGRTFCRRCCPACVRGPWSYPRAA